MKVKLINVAEYEIKEDKVSNIPFNTFFNLCTNESTFKNNEVNSKLIVDAAMSANLPKVRLMKSIEEFWKLSDEEMDEFDKEANVKVLSNGQFLVFYKGRDKKAEVKSTKSNATTDTKENKGE